MNSLAFYLAIPQSFFLSFQPNRTGTAAMIWQGNILQLHEGITSIIFEKKKTKL
jgi:hypothetical protein